MQSDAALDAQAELSEILDPLEGAGPVRLPQGAWEELCAVCEKNSRCGSELIDTVHWQVLAVECMRIGAELDRQKADFLVQRICEDPEYGMGKACLGDPEALGRAYLKEYGSSMEERDAIFGAGSSLERIEARVEAIDALARDLSAYAESGCKPFERHEAGLLEAFAGASKKRAP